MMRHHSSRRHLFTALALIAIVAFAGPVAARSINPGVVDPNDDAYGKSYEDWSVAWWQWVSSLPPTDHPLFDGTGSDLDTPGSNCAAGQQGKVWFLAGTFAGPAVRDCADPERQGAPRPHFQ